MKNTTTLLGIDVGASGIKGAIVDTAVGKIIGERFRVDMPQPSTPEAAAQALNEIVKNFKYTGKIGIGFPSVIKNGVATTAANLDKGWINTNAEDIFKIETGCDVAMINDADAAGIAEMRFGVGRGMMGTVVMITIGTGLGSAVFTDGHLLRNTEFGHIFLKNGMIAEHHASNSAQKRDGLTIKKWAKRFNGYLKLIELYLQPNLIILGGGTSKYFEEFKKKITIETPVVAAQMLNNAGIIGAAIFAAEKE
jgi:polyphosphate glucokinase